MPGVRGGMELGALHGPGQTLPSASRLDHSVPRTGRLHRLPLLSVWEMSEATAPSFLISPDSQVSGMCDLMGPLGSEGQSWSNQL